MPGGAAMKASATYVGYFRVPTAIAFGIAEHSGDPDVLAAWLVLRRFAFGNCRELTAAGAKKLATSLGITRPRAQKHLESLLAMRLGDQGQIPVLMTARDWNLLKGHSVPTVRANAPVYVCPNGSESFAYLPDLLVPPGDARSCLAALCDLDAGDGLDAMRLLLLAYSCVSYGDHIGCDPEQFAHSDWISDGGNSEFPLGYLGCHEGENYWAVAQGAWNANMNAVGIVTGGKSETHLARFWRAVDTLCAKGLLFRLAVANDSRGRLLYPLWVFGEGNRSRLSDINMVCDLARAFGNRAERAGFGLTGELVQIARLDEQATGVFVCAAKSNSLPIVRTIFAPLFAAPTPDNREGLKLAAEKSRQWF